MPMQVKHLNFTLSEELLDKLVQMVEAEQISMSEMLRRCIRLGLVVRSIQGQEDTVLILRRGEEERQIILI